MRDGLVKRVDHLDADFECRYSVSQSVVGGMHELRICDSGMFDDAIRAFVGMHFDSRCGERCRGFRQEAFGDVFVDEEFSVALHTPYALGLA